MGSAIARHVDRPSPVGDVSPSLLLRRAGQPALSIAPRVRRAGLALSGVAGLFLAVDTALKLFQLAPAVEGTIQLGYPASAVLVIGVVELICLALYVTPRTSLLGALLLTGYFGGAIATHVRAESPLFSHTLFPLYLAALVWGGLLLRDHRARALLSLR